MYHDGAHRPSPAALTPLNGSLEVGAVFFPSPSEPGALEPCVDPTGLSCIFIPGLTVGSGTCAVHELTEVDQIPVGPVSEFLERMDEGIGNVPLHAPVAGGRTPLLEALQLADRVLTPELRLEGPLRVVILSDGAPNCAWDADMASALVAGWTTDGIRTHLIDLSAMTEAFAPLAVSGGTDTVHVPTDAQPLRSVLQSVATQVGSPATGSCSSAP